MRLLLLIAALTLGAASFTQAESLTVPGGQPASLPGEDMTLTLTAVQDVRCPPEVDCVWEGLIRVEILVAKAGQEPQVIVLCNMCDEAVREAQAAGQRIELLRLEPSKAELATLGRPAALTDYRVVIDIAAD